MSTIKLVFAGCLALAASSAQAAVKEFDVKYLQTVYEDGRLMKEKQRQSYGFRVEIVSDNEGTKSEGTKNGRPYVTASKGERYSVRLTNPLPVRVAVNLTVDGLNSITGKPCGISDGNKWIIEAYSSVTIPGWQVSGGETRRFFFTNTPKSYAKWQGDNLGRDLEKNCGVIGAAFFWDQKELDRYYFEHPIYHNTYRPRPYSSDTRAMDESLASGRGMNAPAAEPSASRDDRAKKDSMREQEEQAGTGMGERESHPTVQVNFDYDRGMYKVSQALVIYYGFEDRQSPNPFPDTQFAPEMN